ncbi:MAG: esterase/lipase family protein [Oscillospiraceae bacterium]
MKTPQQLLQQTLEVGACLLPDAASGGRTPYPTVFVHGLLGWGAHDALYRAVPYWGLAAGDVLGYLNACGYDCRAASVGIISSAWDRACELYAELTGGTADYGIAHAQRFGHARFGAAYPAPLVPDWGAGRPIDLVGHSFGGATARLLMQLLADGCPEEVQAAEAAGETPSPLFTGGKAGWVHALVAIAAPHDGSTFLDVQPDAANALSTLFLGAARALGISAFKGVYDFRLDQFGIRRDPTNRSRRRRCVCWRKIRSRRATTPLTICAPRVRALNARIQTLPDTWYFSIPCCRTLPRLLTHDQKPDTAMTPLLWPFSAAMGRDGAGVPRDWLPNDGLVNTISARYPAGAPHADFAPGQTPERGVWQVLPVEPLDHLAAIGGVLNTGVVRTRLFYRRVMALLDAAAAADADS